MSHPYSGLPDQHFWRRFVPAQPWHQLALAGTPRFRLAPGDLVATAGSCFAQNIARYMKQAGLRVYIAETPHPLLERSGKYESYELFSARYGNLYTTRQLLELFRQAMGTMPMIEDFVEQDGRVYDLLRPSVPHEGFASVDEARADRAWHLSRVRHMFETAGVFIFTLGLTEAWRHAQHGYTYPVCPGTVRGTWQPEQHVFHNYSCAEVAADLDALLQELKAVNPGLRVILTVSPVQLVATRTEQNVLVASSYSKAALRAACGEIEARHPNVQYFPSYEIISHPASFGQYLDADLRGASERGIAHVMASFFATFYGGLPQGGELQPAPVDAQQQAYQRAVGLLDVECDEIRNEAS